VFESHRPDQLIIIKIKGLRLSSPFFTRTRLLACHGDARRRIARSTITRIRTCMNFCSFPILTADLQQSEPHWTTLVAAFMTPVVASLGILIAFNQWRTARGKLKLDLYEKRLVVYDAVWNTLGQIGTTGKTNQKIEQEFLLGIAGAKWLFDKNMEK
jgi:hypothetical protein